MRPRFPSESRPGGGCGSLLRSHGSARWARAIGEQGTGGRRRASRPIPVSVIGRPSRGRTARRRRALRLGRRRAVRTHTGPRTDAPFTELVRLGAGKNVVTTSGQVVHAADRAGTAGPTTVEPQAHAPVAPPPVALPRCAGDRVDQRVVAAPSGVVSTSRRAYARFSTPGEPQDPDDY